MVVDVVVQNPQKSNEYEYEKKHVRRDSKMCCCCCCRFCCGAPTTDERIHAPVLHDASQIAYCRYWGRASLPPITRSNTGVLVDRTAVGKCDSARDRSRELSTNQMPLLLAAPRAIYQSDTHILASHEESSRISARALVHTWPGATTAQTTQRSMLAAATGALAPPAFCYGRVLDASTVVAVGGACLRPWSSPSWKFWGSNLCCAAVR